MNIKFLGLSLVSLALASSLVLSGCGEPQGPSPEQAEEPVAVEEMGAEEAAAPTPEGETPVAEEEAPEHADKEAHS